MEYKNWTESYGKSLNAAIIIGFVALTGVGAGIGAYVSKDKTFGAIMGGLAGFSVIAVPLLNKKFNKGKKQSVTRDVMPLDPNRECPKGSIKLPINCTQGMDARSIACSKESKRLGGFRCGAYL